MATVRELQARFTATADGLKSTVRDVDRSLQDVAKSGSSMANSIGKGLQSTGKAMQSTGKSLTKYVTAPIVGAGAAVVKFSMDQETSFAKVSTLLQGSEKDMDNYRSAVRAASTDMGVAFDEYAEAVYQSISAGIDQADAIDFVRENVKLAKAGFTDTATAVDLTTTILNAYGMEAHETAKIHDILLNTQNQGKTTVDELSASMGKVIPVAQANNVSVEQLATGYAVLTKNGIATREAGTYMRSMLGELGTAGSEVDEILRNKTGKSFQELSAEGWNVTDVLAVLEEHADDTGVQLSDLFGRQEAGAAALTLMSGDGKEFVEILDTMSDSAGTTEEAFEKMDNTSARRLEKMWIQFQNLGAEVGDIIVPILMDFVEDVVPKIISGIERLANWFGSLSEQNQRWIVILSLIAAAIGPVLVVLGTMVTGLGSLVLVGGKVLAIIGQGGLLGLLGRFRKALLVLGGPIGWKIALFAALVAGGIALYRNWDTIRNKLSPFTDAFKRAFEPIQKVIDIFKNIVTEGTVMRSWISELPDWIQGPIGNIAEIFEAFRNHTVRMFELARDAVAPIVDKMIEIFYSIRDPIIDLVDNAGEYFIFWWSRVSGMFSRFADRIMPILQRIFQSLSKHFNNLTRKIMPPVVKGMGKVQDAFQVVADFVVPLIISQLETFGDMLKSVIFPVLEGLWDITKNTFDAFMDIIDDALSFVLNIFEAFASALEGDWESVWNFVKKAASNAMGILETMFETAGENILKVFQFLWKSVSGVFVSAYKGIERTVTKFIDNVIGFFWDLYDTLVGNSIIPDMINAIVDWFMGLPGRVMEFVNRMVQQVVRGFQNLWDDVINIVEGLWRGIRTTWETLVRVTTEIFTKFFEFYDKLWSDIAYFVIRHIQGMWDRAKEIFETFSRVTSEIFEAVKNFFIDVFTDIRDFVIRRIESLYNRATRIYETLQEKTEEIFTAVRDFFVFIFTEIRDFVIARVERMWERLNSIFDTLQETTEAIFSALRDFLIDLWTRVRDTIIRRVERLWSRVESIFNTLDEVTRNLFNALKTFLVNLWTDLRDDVTDLAQRLWNRVSGTWDDLEEGTKQLFNRLYNWVTEKWGDLRDSVSGLANEAKDWVTNAWDTLFDNTKELFLDIKNYVRDTFTDIVDAASRLPGRIGDAISSMASNMTSGIQSMLTAAARTFEGGLNGVIAGANWILNMLGGSGDTIGDVDIVSRLPWYAHGTDGHPGGPAVVGDGRGSNAGRELIGTPDGRYGLSPARPTLMNLPRGTRVASATDTRALLGNVPKYAFGVGEWVRDRWQSARDSISNVKDWAGGLASNLRGKISDGLDFLSNAKHSFFNDWGGGNLLATVLSRMNLPGMITGRHGEGNRAVPGIFRMPDSEGNYRNTNEMGVMLDILPQMLDHVVRKGGGFLMDKLLPRDRFDPGHGRPDFGPEFVRNNGFGWFVPRLSLDNYSRVHEDGKRVFHHGIDYGAPEGTPIKSQSQGKVIRVSPDHGQINIEHGDYEYIYAHNKDTYPSVGDWVEKGEVIGTVGDRSSGPSGRVAFPHVHYGVKYKGEHVDPDTLGQGYEVPDYSDEYYSMSSSGFSGANFGPEFRLSSRFNLTRRHPIYGDIRPHLGDDWAAPQGTPIRSQSGGVVTGVGYNSGLGNYINIRDGGYTYRYGHNQSNGVRVGQRVNPGDVIGRVGQTGTATGPHVHFEVRRGGASGQAIDPHGHRVEASSPAGTGVERWRPVIQRAAAQMNVNPSKADVDAILRQIQRESSGNERAIQSSRVNDINIRNNNPARGLLQYIPQTFRAYQMPGHTNILSGYDQLLAFFNNRTWRRDNPGGTRGWGPRGGRRYARGGEINHEHEATVGEGGKREFIIPVEQYRERGIALWKKAGEALGVFKSMNLDSLIDPETLKWVADGGWAKAIMSFNPSAQAHRDAMYAMEHGGATNAQGKTVGEAMEEMTKLLRERKDGLTVNYQSPEPMSHREVRRQWKKDLERLGERY